MKTKIIATTALLLVLALPVTAQADRQTLTLSFGQRNVQIDAPLGMCFLDASDAAQAAILTNMRSESWKGRKNVVMTLFADCKEIANLGQSKEMVPLSRVGIIRWLNPDIGEKTALLPNDYLDMREVSFRAHTARDLTQFHDVELEAEPRRFKNSVALGYVGTTILQGQPFKTAGVDATALIHDIPVDISFLRTHSTIDHAPADTKPLYDLAETFIDQQIAINAY